MRNVLLFSTMAAAMFTVASASWAQNWASYPQAYDRTQTATPIEAFSPTDFGYQRPRKVQSKQAQPRVQTSGGEGHAGMSHR